jgi:hypothetical protein
MRRKTLLKRIASPPNDDAAVNRRWSVSVPRTTELRRLRLIANP